MTNRNKLIFAPCDILLPPYSADDEEWKKWAVIACDQHTGENSYWEETEKITNGSPSTLDLVLPENYLGTDKEAEQKNRISRSQKSLAEGWLKKYSNSLVYIERTLSNGMNRCGIVGKIDLECYDYSAGTVSNVRPTEQTVKERIPPRVEIRKGADFEFSHVLLFANDKGYNIIESVKSRKDEMTVLYDFELIQGGGHIKGYLIDGNLLEDTLALIYKYETEKISTGEFPYGVGDGNHSLATARAHYMERLEKYGNVVKTQKARYASVELVSVLDSAIEFHPIYRTVAETDTEKFISALKNESMENGKGVCTVKSLEVVTAKGTEVLHFNVPVSKLTVGALQDFIDAYLKENAGVCDYIHGEDTTRELAKKENTVGILFDGMEKEELFPYVSANGPLPRKTFSMGEADTKRYYLEGRKITD